MVEVGRLTGVRAVASFLDLTEPDLPSVAAALAAAGHRQAVVVPLLFANAFHAQDDAPTAIAAAGATSGMELFTGPILGTDDAVLSVLTELLAEAAPSDDTEIILFAVGSSDDAANRAIGRLGSQLADRRAERITVAFATQDPRVEEALGTMPGPRLLVPLFVAPGLLLDRALAIVERHGSTALPPLGIRLAPVVAQRYRETLHWLADRSSSV